MATGPGFRGILIDIEGTTTPISFVYDVLFPFARRRIEAYCARADEDPQVAEAVERLRSEQERDVDDHQPFGTGAEYALALMDKDRKSTGLKALQGIIWREGYGSGELKAVVFEDVPPALAGWRSAGLRLRIFSSGSVLAQRLLFSHTEQGDLTAHFEGYHDTTTGPKRDERSYRAIAEAFGLPPQEVIYLSDVVAELDPASSAGMRTALLVRPGNEPTDPGKHPVHKDFASLKV